MKSLLLASAALFLIGGASAHASAPVTGQLPAITGHAAASLLLADKGSDRSGSDRSGSDDSDDGDGDSSGSGRGGDDDGADHDANDDHGGTSGNDDGADHDANDDHGGASDDDDDGANHDANDDHGGGKSLTKAKHKSGRKKARIPGGSGCDDSDDIVSHPECRGSQG